MPWTGVEEAPTEVPKAEQVQMQETLPVSTTEKDVTTMWGAPEDFEVVIEKEAAEEVPASSVVALEREEQMPWTGVEEAPTEVPKAEQVQMQETLPVSTTEKDVTTMWGAPEDFEVVIEKGAAEEVPASSVVALEREEQMPWTGVEEAPTEVPKAEQVQMQETLPISTTEKDVATTWSAPEEFEVVIEKDTAQEVAMSTIEATQLEEQTPWTGVEEEPTEVPKAEQVQMQETLPISTTEKDVATTWSAPEEFEVVIEKDTAQEVAVSTIEATQLEEQTPWTGVEEGPSEVPKAEQTQMEESLPISTTEKDVTTMWSAPEEFKVVIEKDTAQEVAVSTIEATQLEEHTSWTGVEEAPSEVPKAEQTQLEETLPISTTEKDITTTWSAPEEFEVVIEKDVAQEVPTSSVVALELEGTNPMDWSGRSSI